MKASLQCFDLMASPDGEMLGVTSGRYSHPQLLDDTLRFRRFHSSGFFENLHHVPVGLFDGLRFPLHRIAELAH
jgi:hypothetical protein